MSRTKEKILILSLVFVLTLVISVTRAPAGQGDVEEGSAAAAASLPVLCFELNDELINPLEGYSRSMSEGCWEQTLYPFGEDLELTVHLLDGARMPEELTYEIRNETGELLIERGSSQAFTGSQDDLAVTVRFADLLEPQTYYRLILKLDLGGESAYYYTRVCKMDGESRDIFMIYARRFHEALFEKETAKEYYPKLEPNDQADKDTLAYVNINSSLDQVSYGASGLVQTSEAWLTVEAIEGNYGYFHFDYLGQADIGAVNPARFRLRESLTLQRNKTSMYLLRYERHMEQLWEIEESAITSAGLLLGVQEEENLAMLSSPDGKITAFTVAGELYSYSSEAQQLSRVFSFRHSGEHPLRSCCRDFGIKLLQMDNSGNLEFLVYGRMNGGRREGYSGLTYYSYDAEKNSLSEKMFISCDKAFTVLKGETETLFGRSGDHFLYFAFGGQVLVMDLSSGETAVLVTREEMPSLTVNEAGTVFAWQSGSKQEEARAVRVVNLETGTSLSVEAEEGEYLRCLGFIREDFLVGVGRLLDPSLNNGQEPVRPLRKLKILDQELQTILEYGYDDMYISGVSLDREKITIRRYGTERGRYVYLKDDVLLRGDDLPAGKTSPWSVYHHSSLLRMTAVPISGMGSFLKLQVRVCDMVKTGAELVLPDYGGSAPDARQYYLAFGKGSLSGVFDRAGTAIAAAAADYGYVTDARGCLVWSWCGRSERTRLSATVARRGETEARDLTGAPFRALVYFLERGKPLLWVSPEGECWILGYTLTDALVLKPGSEEAEWISQTELEEDINRNNNSLWVYP